MIPAGQSGKLTAKVHTRPTQYGSLKKSIVVAVDDPDIKSLNLTLSFTVEAVIEISPRNQIYLNSVIGSPVDAGVVLHRTDGEALAITDIRFDADNVDLHAIPFDPDRGLPGGLTWSVGDVWLEATVNEGAAIGQYTSTAWLTTNHPKMTELEIPVTVRLRPVLEVRPEQVQLWVQEGADAQRGTLFRMVYNREAGFEITGIEIEDKDLVTAELLDSGENRAHSIRVTASAALAAEDLSAPRSTKIVVRTSIEDVPEVVVPVIIAGRRPVTRPLQQRSAQPVTPMPLPTGTPKHS